MHVKNKGQMGKLYEGVNSVFIIHYFPKRATTRQFWLINTVLISKRTMYTLFMYGDERQTARIFLISQFPSTCIFKKILSEFIRTFLEYLPEGQLLLPLVQLRHS